MGECWRCLVVFCAWYRQEKLSTDNALIFSIGRVMNENDSVVRHHWATVCLCCLVLLYSTIIVMQSQSKIVIIIVIQSQSKIAVVKQSQSRIVVVTGPSTTQQTRWM
jgi:hypothetical protein